MTAQEILKEVRIKKLSLKKDGKAKKLLIENRFMCPTCERLLAAGAACPVGHDLHQLRF